MAASPNGNGTPHQGGKSLEILILDPDPGLRDRVARLITRECGIPATVRQAADAEQARNVLEAGGIDLCLADFPLAQQVGFALLGSDPLPRSNTAFVFLTAQARRDWVYEALRHGAQDCIRKEGLDPFEMAKTMAFALYHKTRQMELSAAALRDPLTGLGNRALFDEQVNLLIGQARRNREQLAVVFMDVDGLKPVNDRLGHGVGDDLLRAVAGRITGAMRTSDVVARLGGDEFAAVLPRIPSAQNVAQVLLGITEAVEAQPYPISGHTIRIGLSCGAALYPADGDTPETLLQQADQRMYAAKARRRGRAAPATGQGVAWFPDRPGG